MNKFNNTMSNKPKILHFKEKNKQTDKLTNKDKTKDIKSLKQIKINHTRNQRDNSILKINRNQNLRLLKIPNKIKRLKIKLKRHWSKTIRIHPKKIPSSMILMRQKTQIKKSKIFIHHIIQK